MADTAAGGATGSGINTGAGAAVATTEKSSNIQVTVKVRPLIRREKEAKLTKLWRVKENTIQLVEPASNNNDGFTFGECVCVCVVLFGFGLDVVCGYG